MNNTAVDTYIEAPNHTQEILYFVEDLLLALSVRNCLVGRTYLRDSLVLVCQLGKANVNLSEDVYPVIAERYSTSVSNVSKAIRHCLITCYNDGKLKLANRILRYDIIGNQPPTNAEFISTIAIFVQRYLRAREDENCRFTYFNLK